MSRAQSKQASSASQSNEEISYDIITSDSWDIKSHNVGSAKQNKSGQGKSATLSYGKNKRRFFLKIPKMFAPFGASKPKPKPGEKESENAQWSIQLSFIDDVACQNFQKKVHEFDEFMIDEATKPENQPGLVGASKSKPFSREVVDSKYTHMLKQAKKDGEFTTDYPPFIRAQFPTTFKAPVAFTCEIYDKNNDLMDVSVDPNAPNCITRLIPQGSQCSALLSGSIWSNSNGFGVTWRIAQIKVFPAKGLPKGKCLVDDPEDENETTEEASNQTSSASSASSASSSSSTASTSVQDVSNEADEVEAVEEEEEPAEVTSSSAQPQAQTKSSPVSQTPSKKQVSARK